MYVGTLLSFLCGAVDICFHRIARVAYRSSGVFEMLRQGRGLKFDPKLQWSYSLAFGALEVIQKTFFFLLFFSGSNRNRIFEPPSFNVG